MERDEFMQHVQDLQYRLDEMLQNDKMRKLFIDFYRMDSERQTFFIEQLLYNQKLKQDKEISEIK